MLTSITPLGERGRDRRWGATTAWYVAGSLAGGAAIGSGLGAIGSLVPGSLLPHGAVQVSIIAAILAGSAAIEIGWIPIALPSLPRQVSETWLDTYRGWVIGAGYGFQLGLGVVTIITSPSVHAMLALMLLTHSPLHGLVMGLTFGAARAAPLLGVWTISTPHSLARLHARLDGAAAAARIVAAVALSILAAGVALRSIA